MNSYIIYDHDSDMRDLYIKVIKKFLYTSSDYYKIYEFDKYDSEVEKSIEHIEGTRIYIINIDTPGPSPLDIARQIRDRGDFISPIILITGKKREEIIDKLQNILFLDIIFQDEEFVQNLYRSIKDAYKIVTRHSVYTFSSFDEVYRIPYKDIYYIMKNLNDDSVTIFTKDDTYLNYVTVKAIERTLKEDPRFFKTHRSCIVNLYNVLSYDKKYNVLVFNNGLSTKLISRHNKAILAEKLRAYFNG